MRHRTVFRFVAQLCAVTVIVLQMLVEVSPAYSTNSRIGTKVAGPSPQYILCSPPAGSVISTSATSNQRAWMPTNVSSSELAGPGVVSLSQSIQSSVNSSVSANFSFSVSDLFASASANFGVVLGQSSTASQTWSYSVNVPSGVTAAIHQYKEASDLGFTSISEVQLSSTSCGTISNSSTGGNFFPFKSTALSTFCYALVSTVPSRVATIQVNSGCVPNI